MNMLRWLTALGVGFLMMVVANLAGDEARARLERLPFALLRVARRRLPAQLRERVHDQEWVPELEHILRHSESFPVTRLIIGTRFALGLIRGARAVTAGLMPSTDPGSVARHATARLRGMAADCVRMLIWPSTEPLWLRVYLALVAGTAAAAIGILAACTTLHARDLETFAMLAACGLVSSRGHRIGQYPLYRDITGVWMLPGVILLPPAYALIASVLSSAVNMWRRGRRDNAYRFLFTASARGLAWALGSAIAHATVNGKDYQQITRSAAFPAALLAVACGIAVTIALNILVLTAVKGSAPNMPVLSLITSRQRTSDEAIQLALGVILTFAAARNPLLVIPATPVIILLHKHLNPLRAPQPL